MKAMMLCLMIAVAGCGGSIEPTPGESSAPATADPRFACSGAADAGSATVQATAHATACLLDLCASVSQCGEVTADKPVCVDETNGGQLLNIYACPIRCCW